MIAAREAEHARLRAIIDGFPAERDAAVQRAVQESTQRLLAEHQAREELLKREFAGERNVFDTRITALDVTLKEQSERIARLTQQADKAYGQVQEIAVKALEGTAAFKWFAPSPVASIDTTRRPGSEK